MQKKSVLLGIIMTLCCSTIFADAYTGITFKNNEEDPVNIVAVYFKTKRIDVPKELKGRDRADYIREQFKSGAAKELKEKVLATAPKKGTSPVISVPTEMDGFRLDNITLRRSNGENLTQIPSSGVSSNKTYTLSHLFNQRDGSYRYSCN